MALTLVKLISLIGRSGPYSNFLLKCLYGLDLAFDKLDDTSYNRFKDIPNILPAEGSVSVSPAFQGTHLDIEW